MTTDNMFTAKVSDAMSGRERVGKLRKATCRVCQLKLDAQHYRIHPSRNHPEEDSSNLREYGQKTLFGLNEKKRKLGEDEVEEKDSNDNEVLTEVAQDKAEDKPADKVVLEKDGDGIKALNEDMKQMLTRVGLKVDASACKTEEEKMRTSLRLVEARLSMKNDVGALISKLEELDMMTGDEKEDVKNVDKYASLRAARDIQEAIESVPEFLHERERGKIVCQTCQEEFGCEGDFWKVKKNLRNHLKTLKHKKMMVKNEEEEKRWVRDMGRTKSVGLTIGRMVYHLVYNARPDKDLPLHIYIAARGGADVGDINHSQNLVGKLLPHLAGAVERRLKAF